MHTVLLLIGSNLFMTIAWYWHIKAKTGSTPLILFILVSWAIALPEYCLAVPANRLGSANFGGPFTTPQLKILQEGIALTMFLGFSVTYLKELPRWQDYAGIALILAGLSVALWPRAAAIQ
jgi:hypothetical protein